MALDDHLGETVLGGVWFYDGAVGRRTHIVARNYDREHACEVDAHGDVLTDYEDALEGIPAPRQMGPDGVLYSVENGPQFDTIEEAKAWADAQPWGPVTWDR